MAEQADEFGSDQLDDFDLQGRNLREEIAAHLRKLIFLGQLRPGSKIDQDQIAKSLGISRIPLREAMIILEREGWVVWPPRRGTYVADITRDDIRDYFEILACVSSLVTRRLVESMSEEQRQGWRSLLLTHLARDEREAERMARQRARSLQQAGISVRLVHEYVTLSTAVPKREFVGAPVHRARTKQAEEGIGDAIERGDADGASQLMTDVVREIGERTVISLERNGFWTGTST